MKIHSLVKTFYGRPFGFKIFSKCFKLTNALRNISFCLEYGEFFGFLGLNGVGKITTFICLSKRNISNFWKIYI